MAQSRLEKIGTIYTRVTGLLRSGAMKPEDKPLWYDLYEAFPPKLEPRYDRLAPNIPIKDIFYEEDSTRAKFHKTVKQFDIVNLLDGSQKTQTQQFIAIYKNLKTQGAVDDNQIFETAKELLKERYPQSDKKNAHDAASSTFLAQDNTDDSQGNVTKYVQKATKSVETGQDSDSHVKVDDKKNPNIGRVDVKNLFKD